MLKNNPFRTGACQNPKNCPFKTAGKTISSADNYCENCGCHFKDVSPPASPPWWLLISIGLMIAAAYFWFRNKPVEEPTSGETPVSESIADAPSPVFKNAPPLPVGGKLKGVIELGAESFTYFIIKMDSDKHWKKERYLWDDDTENHTSPFVFKYSADMADHEIRTGLKTYIRNIQNYGVDGEDIHFVVSSGAQEKNKDIIGRIEGHLEDLNYRVNKVNPAQEGNFAYQALVPDNLKSTAFALDIGSGNTKISWGDGTSKTHGAKYFEKNTPDSEVIADTEKAAKEIPAEQRNICFIVGGVPFELAKQTRHGNERFTVLKRPNDYEAKGSKQRSGLLIYKTVAEATGCKQFVFDWDANFTIGFLLSLPY